MPDAQGKYNLNDFVEDLLQRGFDGFPREDLRRIVNRAYFAVAKKSRWEWERVNINFTVPVGTPVVDLDPPAVSHIPYFRTLEKLYKVGVSGSHTGLKMEVMREDDFFESWLGMDFTKSENWNEPTRYFIYDSRLWLLPACSGAREYCAYYIRRPVALINDQDFPITPQHLDEAIIDASRVRAHTRASEPGLAVSARSDLEEAFDDMRDDEEEDMHEMQERVTPDRSWL